MGIEVQLRREGGEVIEAVGDPQMVLSHAGQGAFSGTHLLRYLVRSNNFEVRQLLYGRKPILYRRGCCGPTLSGHAVGPRLHALKERCYKTTVLMPTNETACFSPMGRI